MNRPLNRWLTFCVAVVAIGILPCVPGPRALGTPPGSTPSVITTPSHSHSGSHEGSGPSAGEIIGGILEGLGTMPHEGSETDHSRWRPRPTPSPVWPVPTRPWYVPEPTYPAPVYPVEPAPNRVIVSPQPNRVPLPLQTNQLPTAGLTAKGLDQPLAVEKNAGFPLNGQGITPRMLVGWRVQTRAQTDKVLAEIRDLIPEDASEALGELDEVAERAYAGELTTDDLQRLAASMKSTTPRAAGTLNPPRFSLAASMKLSLPRGMARRANWLFYRLAVLSRLTGLLNTAVPGGGPIPVGNQVPIVLVPGLPRGTVFVLGNGSVVVGVGDLCRFVAVGRGNVAQAAGMCVGIGAPVEDAPAKPTPGALLINADEKLPIHYNVGDNPYTMQPRFRQTLPAGKSWVVAFDRGGSFGEARYTVTEGTYQFALTDKGWDLFKRTFEVTLENRENSFDFFYLVDERRHALGPDDAQKHTGIYPLAIRFDDGRGHAKSKKVESGVYKVAVASDNTLDLFPADAVVVPSIPEPEPNEAGPALVGPPAAVSPPAAVAASPPPPPPDVTSTDGAATSAAANPFSDQGDWRPSLFVSDVPEIAYFDESELGGPPGRTG